MALIDVKCQSCGTLSEVYRAAKDWPSTPVCPACSGPTEQVHLPPRVDRSLPDAVVVFQAPDGSFRFPGSDKGTSTAKYEKLGYKRIEARGFAEVRHLEQQINKAEYSRNALIDERKAEAQEIGASLRRSALRDRMVAMTEGGRQFSRSVVRFNDQQAKPKRTHDPGIHVQVYSNNKSNLE